jgi:transposase InsO family protein
MTIDATGHIAHKSIQHSHYALVAVHSASLTPDGLTADDGGTGYVLLVGLHARSDTLLALQRLFTILQKPPLRIHSDNAPELCSKTADRFFLSLGINHTTPPAYEHHAVGKAERLWDSLKTLARAMMLHSGIPLEFWEYALKHATLIYNCTAPPPNGCAATRFEAYYGSKPDLTHIFPFGAMAYIKISKEQHKALDINSSFGQRSLAGVYLGQDDINGIVKHIIYSDRKLLAATTQNIYINPDIYPFRPAAVIPASIASTYLLKCKTPSLTDLDQEVQLTPENYLQIFVATRRQCQPQKTSPALQLADSIQLDILDTEPTPAKSTSKTQWHQASIIGHSGPKGSRKYLIRWTGYGPEHDQWTLPKDITKALLQEYYDKLREQSTPQLPPDKSKLKLCPKDVVNGDFASVNVFEESKDPRMPKPLIDPLDFTLPRLQQTFKEVIPHNDATYTHLLPTLTTKARDLSKAPISSYINKQAMHAFEEYAQEGQVTAYDDDTNSWRITYPDGDHDLVNTETLDDMILDHNHATPEHHRQHLLTSLITNEAYLANYDEPKGMKQVQAHPEKDLILQAQQKEIDFFIDNGVFTLVPFSSLPKGTDILPSHMIFKKKYTIDKTTHQKVFDKWKARLVIAGNKQKDASPSFAPTPSWSSIRLALSFTCSNKWQVHSYDLTSAFCRTPLNGRAIFVRPPPGLAPPGHLWQLHYAVYGLLDSNSEYNKLFTQQTTSFETSYNGVTTRFEQSEDDPCLFILKNSDGDPIMILISYIDDLIIATQDLELAKSFTTHINETWQISSPDILTCYLGIHFQRLACGGWSFSAKAYLQKAAEKYTRYPLHPHKTPLPTGFVATPAKDETIPQERITHFQSIIGTLLYCATTVRFDISYALSTLAQHLKSPSENLVKMAYRILGYLIGTQDLAITYTLPCTTNEQNVLYGFTDAGFAACPESRRSQQGHVLLFNGGPISWSSKRQPFVCLSTCEAELVALVDTSKTAIYLNKILTFLGVPQPRIVINEDNSSAISISLRQEPVNTSRTKHMDLRIKWLMEQVNSGLIAPLYVPSAANAADIFTKALSPDIFDRLVKIILSPRCNPALSDQV